MKNQYEKYLNKKLSLLKKLIGKRVIKVREAKGLLGNYFVLTFANGTNLAGIDGEYGDDAFEFLNEDEIEEII